MKFPELKLARDREVTVEAHLCKRIKELGGKAYKFKSPQNAGVPDRLCVLPAGLVFFIEVKRGLGKLSPLQVATLNDMANKGHYVAVVYTKEQVDGLVKTIALMVKQSLAPVKIESSLYKADGSKFTS